MEHGGSSTGKIGGRDLQQEPDEETGDDTSQRFRVDRVYAPPARASSPAIPEAVPRARSSPSTMTPAVSGPAEVEIALRHQLSKAQRQLGEMQRELALKEDALATEMEHRMLITAARDKLAVEQQEFGEKLAELGDAHNRIAELERLLSESLATTQELAVLRERERAARAAAQARVDELAAGSETSRGRGADVSADADRSIERLEQEKQAALVAAGERLAKAEMQRRELEESVNTLALGSRSCGAAMRPRWTRSSRSTSRSRG